MDIINVEILEDGTISVKTTDVSDTNHIAADQLLDELESSMGGKRKQEKIDHPFWKNKRVLKGGKIVKLGT